MMKRHIALTIGGALLATTAIAQTTAPSPSAPAPATTAPSAGVPPTMQPAGENAEVKLAGQGKWRASKLMGVDIYGPNNEKVGDVTEVLVDRSGRVEMVTVGVGGFLGIGAKDVAVPFDQVQWSDRPMNASGAPAANAPGTARAPATGTAGTAPAAGNAPAAGTAPMARNAPATGTAPATGLTTGQTANAPAANREPMMYPDHGRISMTKEQLSSAPAVSYTAN